MKFGVAPSELNFFRKMFFPRIQRPPYLKPGKDELNGLLEAQETIIKEGVVVLGAVIQVNNLLFKPGPRDHPGEILICFDPDIEPKALLAIARDVFLLKKGSPRDLERSKISNYLKNELIRVFGLPVPPEINRGHQCFCTSTIFRRKSLPKGVVGGSLIPVLADPSSLLAMILPHQYWTKAGRQQYSGRA